MADELKETESGFEPEMGAALKGEGQADNGKTFSQADVDRILKERLEREKTAREKSTQKAREAAEAEAFIKNQEMQKSQARASEVEAQVTRYQGALEKYLAAGKKDLPKHVLVLLEKLDAVEQIEYLAANGEEISKTGRSEGVPPSPNAKTRSLSEDDLEAARRGQAGLYSNF